MKFVQASAFRDRVSKLQARSGSAMRCWAAAARVIPLQTRVTDTMLYQLVQTGETIMSERPPLPPFTMETAAQKVRMAENAWNTRDPVKVSLAYTEDSRWRNRGEYLQGRDAIVTFLERKWTRGLD